MADVVTPWTFVRAAALNHHMKQYGLKLGLVTHYSSYLFPSLVHSLYCPCRRLRIRGAWHTRRRPECRRFIIYNSKSPPLILYLANTEAPAVDLAWCGWKWNPFCAVLCHCSDSLAFATEPVLGSLANLLGAVERLPVNCQQELKVDPTLIM